MTHASNLRQMEFEMRSTRGVTISESSNISMAINFIVLF